MYGDFMPKKIINTNCETDMKDIFNKLEIAACLRN